MKNRVIAFCNQKGGVSKTTTTTAFATGLVEKGFSVLCIDIDPQPGNLSLAASADKETLQGSFEMFTCHLKNTVKPDVRDFIQSSPLGFDIIAANETLSVAEPMLANEISRESLLRKAIGPLRSEYDFILIDTPPALNVLTINALAAADEIIIPNEADYYATAGMVSLARTIYRVKDGLNPTLRIRGIVVTKFRSNTNLQNELVTALEELSLILNAPVFKQHVRLSVVVQDAQKHRRDLFEFSPTAPVTNDYKNLINEYLAEEGEQWSGHPNYA